MNCLKPLMNKGLVHGCGQCLPCRINKKRIWITRLQLEAQQWASNSFLTLTYNDEHLPPSRTLVPRHLTLFFKKLRHDFPHFRYFACGEYGDQTKRPHYHVVMFNFPTCERGSSQFKLRPNGNNSCCPTCDRVRDLWGMGHIINGTCTKDSIQYVAGYVTKKLSKPDDERLELGQYPEFARMSRRPGIGFDSLHEIASQLLENELENEPVPAQVRIDGKMLPLGPSMRKKLSQYVGQPKNLPVQAHEEASEVIAEMRQMLEEEGIHKTVLHQVLLATIAQNGERSSAKAVERHKRHDRKGKGPL